MAAVVIAVVVYGYGSVVVYGHGLVVVYGYGFGAVVVDGRGDDDGGRRASSSLNLLSSFVSNVFSRPVIFSMASSKLFSTSCTCSVIIC